MPPRIIHKTLVGILLFISPLASYAQQKQNLESVLLELEQRFQVKFSYADSAIEGLEVAIDPNQPLTTIIDQIKAQVQLDIEKLSNRYYTISKPKKVSICGRVLDNFASNKIPGATVEVIGASNILVTDVNGEFQLDDVARNAALRIRYMGFVTKIINAESLLGPDCPNILLSEQRQLLNEVVVYQLLTPGISLQKDAGIGLDMAKLGILPGLAEPDVLQTIQALPGINSIDETVSDINVRGGTNDQNLVLWNGIKIYQSGHFFGLISAFNPYLVKDVRVFKNGTPSKYGDGVSSLIAMHTNDDLEGRFSGGGGVNFISGDIFGQMPIRDNLELQFSARRSTTDLFTTPTYDQFTDRIFQDVDIATQSISALEEQIKVEENFRFYDFTGKLLYNINKDHKLRLSFITITNNFDLTETDVGNLLATTSSLNQNNVSAGLQWQAQWHKRFSTNVRAYFSNYDLNALSTTEAESQQILQRNNVDERALQINSGFSLSDNFHWNNGFDYAETGITNTSDVTQPPFQRNIRSVIRKYAPHTQLHYNAFADKILFWAGLRANYLVNLATAGASFQKILLEPRFNLNFKLAKNLRAQVLGELKSQTANQVIDLEQNFFGIEKRRWILSDNDSIPITKSRQASLAINHEANGLYLGIEAFYKRVDGLGIRSQGFQNEGQFEGNEVGSYETNGVEFLINKKTTKWSTWISYTYNNNDYTFDAIQPNVFPNNLDVRHAITLAGTLQLKNWKLAMGANYRSGKPYTPPDAENPLDTNTFPLEINYVSPNSERLPDYFRLDFSASYKYQFKGKIRFEASASLLNLSSRTNVLNRYYRLNDNDEIETVENYSLGLTPNVSFRISF